MEEEKNIHAAHRKRMKEEFRERGLQGMQDHRVLELLLFYAIPRGDVNPLAHALLNHFGSFYEVFHATYDELIAVKGINEHTATLIMLVLAVEARYLQDKAKINQPRSFQTSWQFKELLEPYFTGARSEMAYLVCMDPMHNLLYTPEKIGDGVVNAVAISTRKVMETALARNASVVVLAHNHLSGLAIPSADDIVTTQHLSRSLRQVGIRLHDHFVLADGDMVSMRQSGYLEE